MDQLRTELEETRIRNDEVNSVLDEWKLKIQAWEEERSEERDAYERKLNEVIKRFCLKSRLLELIFFLFLLCRPI